MANVYLQDSTLTAIGNAIRTKAGNTTQLLPSEMPNAIANLPSGGSAKFNVYRGDSSIDNRLKYTNAQTTSLLLSDMGVTAKTFKNLRSVNANFANGKSIFNCVFTTRLINAERAVTWEVYPKLAENLEYPQEVIDAAKTFGSDAEVYPAVFACNNNISSTSTATTVWSILNGITGSAWQPMALGIVSSNRLYLGIFDYTTSGPRIINPSKYIIGQNGYVYWRY